MLLVNSGNSWGKKSIYKKENIPLLSLSTADSVVVVK